MTGTVAYLAQTVEIINAIDVSSINKVIAILKNLQIQNNGRLFILGVGGSASNASHAVNDFRKIANIETYAPTDNVAELTARTNDNGWESVFVDWLKVSKLGNNDVIMILSVGGGSLENNISVNLVKAIDHAKIMKSKIVGIVGRDGGHTAKHADAYIRIPSLFKENITPHTEGFQSMILHLIVSQLKL